MLSADELFKVRHGFEKSVPDKGGTKDFMPQGTWLENKQLEKIHEERELILAEPRIQRKCDWVKGTWVPEKQLVELFHEMRNFWQYMGFLSRQQKWLYPEEALFLMETNVLEVWYKGVSLSIQEAYARMLGGRVNLEMFQVYSHLRRIGYVVLRHRGRLETTEYERKIGLDKVSKLKKQKNRNRKRKKDDEVAFRTESGEDDTERKKKLKTGDEDKATNHEHITCASVLTDTDTVMLTEARVKGENEAEASTQDNKNSNGVNNTVNEMKMTHEKKDENDKNKITSNFLEGAIDMKGDNVVADNVSKVSEKDPIICEDKNLQIKKSKTSVWDFTEIILPDFGIQNDIIVLHPPPKTKFLENFEFSSTNYTFHRKTWINKKKENKRNIEEDMGRLSESLEFSYTDCMGGKFRLREECKTWAEFKVRLQELMVEADREKMVPHLHEGGVSPLVQPHLATCTRSVLEQLSIVKEETPEKRSTEPDNRPDFDVYLPNDKFKKSQPGVPDFRICVTKGDESPPDLAIISQITGYLQDSVPLQWGVVESDDIAFFSLKDFILPTDISLG